METLLVVLAVAAAVLWAALRIRRTVRAAARKTPVGAACASCPVADACDPASRPGAGGAGPRAAPPR